MSSDSTNSEQELQGPLSSELRKQLERMVVQARRIAIKAAQQEIKALTVDQGKRGEHVTTDQQISLRNRLRAHARFLGDRQNSQSGEQKIDRLVEECAYQHWHRMLFARFLLENGLLIFPETGTAIGFDEVEEIADESGLDVWELAGRYAQEQLPAIFRADNPVLELEFSSEYRAQLTEFLESPAANSKLGLPTEIFLASDSLGWVYQFWQNDENERANKSEDKIDSSTLPAVTQFFTEDYMVMFLLHNTLGAWHAGKVLAANPKLAESASDEEELRRAVALNEAGGYQFEYLRFVREPQDADGDDGEGQEKRGPWRPMGGTFDGWPKTVAELKVLDPCCGSGHFLVAALELLARLRMHEEGLDLRSAIDAVLQENLFGLELDKRCTQIAVFNLAMSAWKLDDSHYRNLPSMTIAHVGQSIGATKDQWMQLLKEADDNEDLGFFWGQLYDMFSQASTLGSLINPRRFLGSHQLSDAQMQRLTDLLESAVAVDPNTEAESHELQLAAKGLATATKLLADCYQLVITNVPYLGQKKQVKFLKDHIETYYQLGKADLATAFILRCSEFAGKDGTVTAVTPQNWLFLATYSKLRETLLASKVWNLVVFLGEHAFESSAAAGAFAALASFSNDQVSDDHAFFGIDVSAPRGETPIFTAEKASLLRGTGKKSLPRLIDQKTQLVNPDSRVTFAEASDLPMLEVYATNHQGLSTGDNPRFRRQHWEISERFGDVWVCEQSGPDESGHFCGRTGILKWQNGQGELWEFGRENVAVLHNVDRRGEDAWGRHGVAVRQLGVLPVTRYTGQHFDTSVAVLVPKDECDTPALWCFCESEKFPKLVREANPKVSIDNGYFTKVHVDLNHWRNIAGKRFPSGLPEPESDDPTQWLFHGWPAESTSPLHVAVARLLGYRWPAELDPEMRLSDRARELVSRCSELDSFVDEDGIVCIPHVRGEDVAADRLASLLNAIGVAADENLDDWLRNRFFKEHCELFEHRPFVWHIWDGRKQDGFHALVNYHKLAGPRGHKVLERLTYSYLGDWIERREDEVKRDVSGADARLLAARELRTRLEAILAGEPPYDIFVRWKSIREQPIGWNPDINDGVRINIRPFMQGTITGGQKDAGILRVKPKRTKWGKDRGKEPKRPIDEYPWFWSWDQESKNFQGGDKFDGLRWNDCHYTNDFKQASRDTKGAQS